MKIDAFVIDAPAACLEWNPHFFSPCLIGSPNGPVSLSSGVYTYDTSLGTLVDSSHAAIAHATFTVDQGGTPAWGMNVTDLVVAAGVTLRVVGTKPLIIAAWGTIEIDGTIDASSPTPPAGQTPTSGGAGADPMLCGTSTGVEGQKAGLTTGGSGGGGFGSPGGQGGASNALIGGMRGSAAVTPHLVRGGCAGGASDAQQIAYGGLGGGAVQLTAQTTLRITGDINAGGGGGQAGRQNSRAGGAGGGAGGWIGLEAATLVLQTGSLGANGGGGASGEAISPGSNGQDGALGAESAKGGVAPFGCQSAGGSGGTIVTGGGGQSAMDSTASCTGGGGGGGVGFVLLFSNQITANVTTQSPAGLVNPF